MAKVIGIDEKLMKVTSCRRCASIIQYVPNEVVKNTYRDIDGSSDTQYLLTCPACSNTILVDRC